MSFVSLSLARSFFPRERSISFPMLFIYVGLNSRTQWERCGIPSLHCPSRRPGEKKLEGEKEEPVYTHTHTHNHICYSYYEFELWVTASPVVVWAIPVTWIFKRLPSPSPRKRKKKNLFFFFMIHFESGRWEFSCCQCLFPLVIFAGFYWVERKRRASVKWFWPS
jgi:hypothetical protein